jgi:hypothetical protein
VNWLSLIFAAFLALVLILYWQNYGFPGDEAPVRADLRTYHYHHHLFEQDTRFPGPPTPTSRALPSSQEVTP